MPVAAFAPSKLCLIIFKPKNLEVIAFKNLPLGFFLQTFENSA